MELTVSESQMYALCALIHYAGTYPEDRSVIDDGMARECAALFDRPTVADADDLVHGDAPEL
jgi:hypothetical protein